MNRREFIAASATLCLSGNLVWQGLACAGQTVNRSEYYAAHRSELLGAFRGVLSGATAFWEKDFGKEQAAAIAGEAEAAYEKLLPGLPDVGGERNWDVEFIPLAAWYVALYEPLRKRGWNAAAVGKLIYELNEYMWASTPKETAQQQGDELFSAKRQAYIKEWAAWTQRREYPANWVATYVEGDGRNFDFGVQYCECGVVKYLQSQGVPELAPYVCSNDFIKSRAIGSGLLRRKTIARGDGVCDFRYTKNGPVTQNWDTELQLIQQKGR